MSDKKIIPPDVMYLARKLYSDASFSTTAVPVNPDDVAYYSQYKYLRMATLFNQAVRLLTVIQDDDCIERTSIKELVKELLKKIDKDGWNR